MRRSSRPRSERRRRGATPSACAPATAGVRSSRGGALRRRVPARSRSAPAADGRATIPSVTKSGLTQRCRWCARAVPDRRGPGRPRVYCRQSCRQSAYLARKLAETHGLGVDDVVVARGALEELLGRLYCLQAAVEDVERDLASDRSARALRDAFRWLLDNAKPLAEVWLEPKMAEEALG